MVCFDHIHLHYILLSPTPSEPLNIAFKNTSNFISLLIYF